MGPLLDANPVIGSVNNPLSAPFYPEPFLLFASDVHEGVSNQQRLLRAGWSVSKQEAAMRRDIATPAKHTKRVIVYLDINPSKFPTQTSVNTAFMWELVDKHVAYYPKGRAGIENYSMRLSHTTGNGNYQNMLKGIAARSNKAWTSVQLARPKVIGGDSSATVTVWPEVTDYWERLGGHAVETTGMNEENGQANVWPASFVPRQGIVARQDAAFAQNIHP